MLIFFFLFCVVDGLFVFNFVNGFVLPFEGLYRLDVLHYNDFHMRFQETSVRQATCSTNDNLCLGGFARLYYEISKLRDEKPHSILLNAGDSFQGTLWYTLMKWNVTQKFMNMLPHDAHAIGNHEFDDGPAGLAPYIAALNAPVLAANMDSSNEPQLDGLYEPSIIIRRKGRRIGIIGLITPETKDSSSPGNVIFTDPKAATEREAKKLALRGVDIIVVLSHCGLQMDKEIARDSGKYVDVIVGGHSHSLLWNGASPSGENVEGPYPVIVQPTADNKHKVLIVQSSAFTKYMGNLSVYFDVFGNYVKWDGGSIFLNRSIPEDPIIKAKLEPFAQIIRDASNAEIGQSSVLLDHELCMSGECALGNVLVDAMNDYAKQKITTTYPFIAFMQRGNIKSTLLPGVITHGMILEMLPFQNRFISFEIKGSFIFDALEHAVKSYWQYQPYQTPWLLQVSGLKVSYDVSKPEGQRVLSVTVGDQNTPLDLQATYQVSVPDYLADGGDGFSMFKNGKQNVQILGRDDEIVVEYITAHSPLTNVPEGRINIQF